MTTTVATRAPERTRPTASVARQWDRLQFIPELPALIGKPPPLVLQELTEQDLAAAARMARLVVPAAAEVLAGIRPVDQVSRWMTPALFDALARRAGLATRILGPARPQSVPRPRVRRTQVQATPSGACEALVLLDEGDRVRGAAVRLERRRDRWVVANLEIA